MGRLPTGMVTFQGNGKYTVQSQSVESLQYSVDLEAGFCECNVGENGSLCKHQAACAEYSMTVLPQVFTATSENSRWLASVAVSEDKTPPESFFRGLLEPQQEESDSTFPAWEQQGSAQDPDLAQDKLLTEEDDNHHEDPQQCADISELVAAFQNVAEKYSNGETAAAISTAVRRLNQVRSANQLNSILYNLGSDASNTRAGRGKIRCQPTSISRRGPGKPRGAAPLGKGRRPSSVANRKSKRPRSLSSNVAQNVANAKSHGSGH